MFHHNQYQTSILLSNHIFKDSIERIYEVFRNPTYLEQAFQKFNLQITPLNNPNDKFDTKNATFNYALLSSNISCKLIVEHSINEEHYKLIQIRSISEYPCEFVYRLKLIFYWCSIMKQTVYKEEVTLLYKHSDYLTQELINTYDEQANMRFKIIDKYLKEFTFKLNQCESVIINSNFEETCKGVSNMNVFIQLSPSLGDRVILSNMNNKVGSEILLVIEGEKTYFKIIRNEYVEDKLFFELEIIDKEHKRKMPKQIVQFTLIKITEKQTFLSFVHVFIDPIRFSTISKMETNKKKILSDLKKNLERITKCRSLL